MNKSSDISFYIIISLLSAYIVSFRGLGFYYDYLLIDYYPLIARLNYGTMSVDQYLSELPDFERGFRQFDLARIIGTTSARISIVETRSIATRTNLVRQRFASALGCEVEELFDTEGWALLDE